MAIEIVDFPIKHGDFPLQNVSSPEGIRKMVVSWDFTRHGACCWSVSVGVQPTQMVIQTFLAGERR